MNDSHADPQQILPDKLRCTRAIPVRKCGWFVIEPVVFGAVCVANVHQTVGMQHQFFGNFATHKQNLGRVLLEKKVLGEPRADNSV